MTDAAIPLSQRNTIRFTFLLHALASGGFYTRIGDIQKALGLDEATLGLALLGQTAGLIAVLGTASPLVERLGTRPLILLGIPGIALGLLLVSLMPNALLLFVALAVYGAIYGLTNIAMNIEADRIEAQGTERLMNSCHGIWSLGQLAATSLGTLASALALSPAAHLGGWAVPLILLALAVLWPLRPAPVRPHAADAKTAGFAWPTAAVLLLVAFIIGPSVLEGALRNWSVIYLRDSFAAPNWVSTLSLPVFLLAQSLGRLSADRWVMRWGPVRVARGLTALALLGALVAVLAPSLPFALGGFVLIGVGVCAAYPLVTTAAAGIGDRPASQNVASLTLATQLAVLGAPALLGWVATSFGIRMSFAICVPLVVVAIALARYLQPRQAA